MEKRIVFSDNEVIEDISIDLNNYHSGVFTKAIVASEDYLYVGARLPFNSVYFIMSAGNENSGSISVDYWDGHDWRATVDVLDETNGFANDGHVTFTPDRDRLWHREHTNYNNERVDGLGDVVIYNQYWARFSISHDTSAIGIKWVGDLFCSDDDIYSEYPELASTNAKESFEANKTSWQEQIVIASRMCVNELINKQIIKGGEQILNWRDYTLAAVSKTVQLIFAGFGPDYEKPRIDARNEFSSRITKKIHRVDLDKDAIESVFESQNETGFLKR